MRLFLYACVILFSPCFTQITKAQNIIEGIRGDTIGDSPLFLEQIQTIAKSKRIFVISNTNKQLTPGDFISLIKNEKLTARALVAKIKGNKAGIKILKIYSLNNWTKLTRGSRVQILRGDDSFYRSTGTTTVAARDERTLNNPRISSEEDLYNDDTLLVDEDVRSPPKDSKIRSINSNNLFSASLGRIRTKDNDNANVSVIQWSGAWGYQVVNNVFAEVRLGASKLKQFPSEGFEATLLAISGRFKYNFKAPFYSFFMPYIGYQILNLTEKPSEEDISTLSEEEQDALDNAGLDKLIYGITVMRRLVPGWFVKLDLGNDVLSAGLTVEF